MSSGEEEDELPQRVADLANANTPNNLRTVLACKRCGLLKTYNQFYDNGCDNCPFLTMNDDQEACNRYTTAFYEGQAAVMDPRESWVAKWLRVDNYLPGVYAISVIGTLDLEAKEILENGNYSWRCRPVAS